MASATSGFVKDLAKLYGFGCLGLIVMGFAFGYVMTRSGASCPPQTDTLVASPNGTREAVVFHFDCGFGKKGTTNVSVQFAGEEVGYPANLFVAMDSSGMNFLLGRGARPAVRIVWEDSTSLMVQYAGSARIVAKRDSARGVRAHFAEMAAPP